MIEHLAQSVEEIVRGCSSHLEFEEGITRLSQRIRASTRVAPELYCIYFDLLQAVRRDDLDASARLLGEMDTRMAAPLPSFYSRWGALPESTARRYFTYVNVDPTTQVNFKALSSSEFDKVRRIADDAFGVFEGVAPEIGAEIRSLLSEIVFVSGLNITQCAPEGMNVINYLHIELTDHDIVYAEGAPAETFGSLCEARDQFYNFYEYYRLYKNEDETARPPCAPLLWGESRLDRVMQPLRNALQPWIDLRVTRDKIRDRLTACARDVVD